MALKNEALCLLMNGFSIRRPDDFHVHFREGDLLRLVAPYTAAQFARALVMPNTVIPIVSAQLLSAYRDEIKSATNGSLFEPLMTFKISSSLKADSLSQLKAVGALAGKFYPVGVTTNSNDGISSLKDCVEILSAMQELDIVLCVHAEEPGASSLDGERSFLYQIIWLVHEFPHLRVVFEHVSTAEALNLVASLPPNVAATITVHHMLFSFDDLIGDSLRPHLFCKPLLQSKKDREAILDAAFSGNPKFFFGSDSAPHVRSKKESGCCPAGIFSAPVALSYLASIFDGVDKLSALEPFVSEYGAIFYGLPLNDSQIYLDRSELNVPATVGDLVPLAAGSSLGWVVSSDRSCLS